MLSDAECSARRSSLQGIRSHACAGLVSQIGENPELAARADVAVRRSEDSPDGYSVMAVAENRQTVDFLQVMLTCHMSVIQQAFKALDHMASQPRKLSEAQWLPDCAAFV